MTNPADFLGFSHRLADAARPIARHYFASQAKVEMKGDNSPVTAADREIEAALRQMIEETFPSHGIIGEEQGEWNADAEWVWVIDPIDGTRAFIAQRPSFVTLIALCRHGVPVLGVIDQPIKDERWLGCEGQATTFNGAVCSPSDGADISQAMISTTSIPYFSAPQALAFARLEKTCRSTLLNQDGYAFGMLASGDMDVVVETKLKPYDFCALVPVVQGAGGIITDWQGNLLNVRSSGDVAAAANPALHAEMMAHLR